MSVLGTGVLSTEDQILFYDQNFYPLQEICDKLYKDIVYNFMLEDQGGFFANNIYVGDFNLQNRLEFL